MSVDSLPHAHGDALLRARIRVEDDDFRVIELPSFEPGGQGEHLLLEIEKRGMTTAFAAQRIADWAGVAPMAVSYAGMKDRHAVTRQRFSVHLPKRVAPPIETLAGADLRPLSATWHGRKLPRGALAGNRFELVLRDVALDRHSRDEIEQRLQRIAASGVPNYFGEQRFGRDGGNIEQARRLFAGARMRREQRGMVLSAARSALFNEVLARRVEQGHWASGLDGDVWMLDGSHSVFGPVPLDDALRERVARFDIHPTGPLAGAGELRSVGAVREIEAAVLAAQAELVDGLTAFGLRQERRALRIAVAELRHAWLADDRLQLEFRLPPGAYATVVLRELGTIVDARRSASPGAPEGS